MMAQACRGPEAISVTPAKALCSAPWLTTNAMATKPKTLLIFIRFPPFHQPKNYTVLPLTYKKLIPIIGMLR
jgi:hypothetical protein